MESQSTKPNNFLVKTTNREQENPPRLSDDAFYLIALASLLKKMEGPASLEQIIGPGKFNGFNDGVHDREFPSSLFR